MAGHSILTKEQISRSILVSKFPQRTDFQRIIIYFQKGRNGGGELDVESSFLVDEESAVIVFDHKEVAEKVLTRKHKFDGVLLDVIPYQQRRTKPLELFTRVSAEIDPTAFDIQAEDLAKLLEMAHKETFIDWHETCHNFLVSGTYSQLQSVECILRNKLKPIMPPDEILEVTPKFMTFLKKGYGSELKEIEVNFGIHIAWDGQSKDLTLSCKDKKRLENGKNKFIELYQKIFPNTVEDKVEIESGDRAAVRSAIDLAQKERPVLIDQIDNQVKVYGVQDEVDKVVTDLKSRFGKKNLVLRTSTTKAQQHVTGHSGMNPPNASAQYPSPEPQCLQQNLGNGVTLFVYQGDLTTQVVDVIVNAANERLQHGGGVAGAIANKGGEQIWQESRLIIQQRGKLAVGEAVWTSAGRLPCHGIIHTVGPQWAVHGHDGCIQLLHNACTNSLQLANYMTYRSIAFPAISSGIYGVPTELCAQVMFDAAEQFSVSSEAVVGQLKHIGFVNIDKPTVDAFKHEFRQRYQQRLGATYETNTVQSTEDKSTTSSSWEKGTILSTAPPLEGDNRGQKPVHDMHQAKPRPKSGTRNQGNFVQESNKNKDKLPDPAKETNHPKYGLQAEEDPQNGDNKKRSGTKNKGSDIHDSTQRKDRPSAKETDHPTDKLQAKEDPQNGDNKKWSGTKNKGSDIHDSTQRKDRPPAKENDHPTDELQAEENTQLDDNTMSGTQNQLNVNQDFNQSKDRHPAKETAKTADRNEPGSRKRDIQAPSPSTPTAAKLPKRGETEDGSKRTREDNDAKSRQSKGIPADAPTSTSSTNNDDTLSSKAKPSPKGHSKSVTTTHDKDKSSFKGKEAVVSEPQVKEHPRVSQDRPEGVPTKMDEGHSTSGRSETDETLSNEHEENIHSDEGDEFLNSQQHVEECDGSDGQQLGDKSTKAEGRLGKANEHDHNIRSDEGHELPNSQPEVEKCDGSEGEHLGDNSTKAEERASHLPGRAGALKKASEEGLKGRASSGGSKEMEHRQVSDSKKTKPSGRGTSVGNSAKAEKQADVILPSEGQKQRDPNNSSPLKSKEHHGVGRENQEDTSTKPERQQLIEEVPDVKGGTPEGSAKPEVQQVMERTLSGANEKNVEEAPDVGGETSEGGSVKAEEHVKKDPPISEGKKGEPRLTEIQLQWAASTGVVTRKTSSGQKERKLDTAPPSQNPLGTGGRKPAEDNNRLEDDSGNGVLPSEESGETEPTIDSPSQQSKERESATGHGQPVVKPKDSKCSPSSNHSQSQVGTSPCFGRGRAAKGNEPEQGTEREANKTPARAVIGRGRGRGMLSLELYTKTLLPKNDLTENENQGKRDIRKPPGLDSPNDAQFEEEGDGKDEMPRKNNIATQTQEQPR